ncbi:type II CAAX prenyl endopeptidase Rce1 family protein, partial [Natronoarchaeum mannanilyticum]
GALVLALDRLAFAGHVAVGSGLAGTPLDILGVGVLAALAGGTYEEILLRFGAMTLVVWTLWRLRPGPDGMPQPWMVWLGVVLTSVLFALGHLPATAQLTALTPAVIVRALVLNGLPGALFGWLYWKGGLEAAMIAHFGAGLVLHVGGGFL